MTPEIISAASAGVVAILGAILGYLANKQTKKVADLEARVGRLEEELAHSKSLFRMAIRFIRELLGHIVELTVAHRLGHDAPPTPEVPELLREEV
ncbi:hypothetical protein [Nocardia sp. IFM 10818]